MPYSIFGVNAVPKGQQLHTIWLVWIVGTAAIWVL